MDAQQRSDYFSQQERLKCIPSELREKTLDEAKAQAKINISESCDKSPQYRNALQDAILENDNVLVESIRKEYSMWKAKKDDLCNQIEACKDIEQVAYILTSFSGKLDY